MGSKKPTVITLDFDGTEVGRGRFGIIHQAITFGCDHEPGSGIDRMRRVAALLDKLDAISEPVLKDGAPVRFHTGDEIRQLSGPGTVTLDLGELELLEKAADRVNWRGGKVPEVVATLDWLKESRTSRNGGPPKESDDDA